MAPDGSCFSWLQGARDNLERSDLWRGDPETGRARLWLRGQDLASSGALTQAEKAAMERRRQFLGGITEQQWMPDGGQLLLSAHGAGWLLDQHTGEALRLTPEGQRYTDLRLSPGGAWLSCVGDGALFIRRLSESGPSETAGAGADDPDHWRLVAAPDSADVSFGIADFLAQEEMHRYDGHWWSLDERFLAFTRTDLTPTPSSHRFEADAGGVRAVETRYPFAGGVNPTVQLALFTLATGETHWLDLAEALAGAGAASGDVYLARAGFTPEGLVVQLQNREQTCLEVWLIDPETRRKRCLISERGAPWINLHDNFRALGPNDYLWTSERGGSNQLYRYQDGNCIQISHGPGRVNDLLWADSDTALYSGWRERPVAQQLYRIKLQTGRVSALTDSGWHQLTCSECRGEPWLFDLGSSLEAPPSVRFSRAGEHWLSLRPEANEAGARADAPSPDVGPQHPYRPYLRNHCTPELGSLVAEDGQTLYYRLTRPRRHDKALPLILCVYGGPGVQRVRDEWPPLSLQLFVGNGFATLELDNRGGSNRAVAFEAPLRGRLGDVEVRDQALGVETISRLPWVDGNRVGVFGHSYGGYLALMCLARRADLFKAGVAVAPVTDWRLYDSHYTERYLGHPRDNPEGYRDSAVLSHLDSFKGRLLLMHGMSDDNVLFNHTLKLMDALQTRHQAFDFMAYPGARHGLQEPSVAIHRFNAILNFFRERL